MNNTDLLDIRYRPYKLYSEETFFDGIAHTVDLDENLVSYNTSSSVEEVNRKAIISDILNIACDMSVSIKEFKKK